MIVTCRVPTWGLLVGRRQDFHVELAVNMGPAGYSYVSDLGIRMTVFSATLDSKNVRILAQAPCTKPRPVFDIEHPEPQNRPDLPLPPYLSTAMVPWHLSESLRTSLQTPKWALL
jgi:hypothetical protein